MEKISVSMAEGLKALSTVSQISVDRLDSILSILRGPAPSGQCKPPVAHSGCLCDMETIANNLQNLSIRLDELQNIVGQYQPNVGGQCANVGIATGYAGRS